jgi:hypothetical protein
MEHTNKVYEQDKTLHLQDCPCNLNHPNKLLNDYLRIIPGINIQTNIQTKGTSLLHISFT